jgi:hypothetical protein
MKSSTRSFRVTPRYDAVPRGFCQPVPVESIELQRGLLAEPPEGRQQALGETSQQPWPPNEAKGQVVHF